MFEKNTAFSSNIRGSITKKEYMISPQDIKINYLLGIDGGGTKTEFLLTDLYGKTIKRKVLGPSNPVNIGIENTKQILKTGITRICEGINPAEISLFAGLAGGITGDNKENIGNFLSGLGFGAFDNGSDTENALKIALDDDDGIVVIVGTGIVAFAQKNGIRKRIGGWGFLIDKGGSGFHFGSDALNSALSYLDGRGGSPLILSLIEKQLNKPLTDAIPDIYAAGAAYAASFAPVIFEAFKNGDKEADAIIGRNAREIALIIRTGLEFTENKAVLCGGLCRHKDILEPFLTKEFNDGINLIFSDESPINGAVKLAKSIIQE